jgi:hypothetical protein
MNHLFSHQTDFQVSSKVHSTSKISSFIWKAKPIFSAYFSKVLVKSFLQAKIIHHKIEVFIKAQVFFACREESFSRSSSLKLFS